MSADLKIVEIKAFPTSFPVPPENRVALGIGTAINFEFNRAIEGPGYV